MTERHSLYLQTRAYVDKTCMLLFRIYESGIFKCCRKQNTRIQFIKLYANLFLTIMIHCIIQVACSSDITCKCRAAIVSPPPLGNGHT